MSWAARRGHIVQHNVHPKTGSPVLVFSKDYLDGNDKIVRPYTYTSVDSNGKSVRNIAYKYVTPEKPNTDLYLVPIEHRIPLVTTNHDDSGGDSDDDDDSDGENNMERRRRYVKVQYDPSVTDPKVMWDNFVAINKMGTDLLSFEPCKHSGSCNTFTGVTLPPKANYWSVPSYFKPSVPLPSEKGLGEFVEKPVGITNKISLMKEYLKEQHHSRGNYVRVKTQRAPIPQIIGTESSDIDNSDEAVKRREAVKVLLSQASTIPAKIPSTSSSLDDSRKMSLKDTAKTASTKGVTAAKDVASKGAVVAKDVAVKGVVVAKDVAIKGAEVAKEVATRGATAGKKAVEVATPIIYDTVKGAVKQGVEEGIKGGIEGGVEGFTGSITDGSEVTPQSVAIKTTVGFATGAATGAVVGAVKGGAEAAVKSTSKQIKKEKQRRLNLAQSKALKVDDSRSSKVVSLDPVLLDRLSLDTEDEAAVEKIKRNRKELLKNYVTDPDTPTGTTSLTNTESDLDTLKIRSRYDPSKQSTDDPQSLSPGNANPPLSTSPVFPMDSVVTTTTTTVTTTTANKSKQDMIREYLEKFQSATNQPSGSGDSPYPPDPITNGDASVVEPPPMNDTTATTTTTPETTVSKTSEDMDTEDSDVNYGHETDTGDSPGSDESMSNLEHWKLVMSHRDESGYYKPIRPLLPHEIIAKEDEGFPHIAIPPVGSKFFPPNPPFVTNNPTPLRTVVSQPNPQFQTIRSKLGGSDMFSSSSMIGCDYHRDYSDHFPDTNGGNVQLKQMPEGYTVIKIGVDMNPSVTKLPAPVIREDVLCAAYGLNPNCLRTMERDYQAQLAAYESALAERDRQIEAIKRNNEAVLQEQQAIAVAARDDVIQSQLGYLQNQVEYY